MIRTSTRSKGYVDEKRREAATPLQTPKEIETEFKSREYFDV